MVAVGGGDEGDVTQLLPDLLAGHPLIGQLADVHPQPPGQVAADGEAPPQHLKGVEAEAVAFVLDIDAAQAQCPGQAGEVGKGGDRILGEAGVERPGLFGGLHPEGGDVAVPLVIHGAGNGFEAAFHNKLLSGWVWTAGGVPAVSMGYCTMRRIDMQYIGHNFVIYSKKGGAGLVKKARGGRWGRQLATARWVLGVFQPGLSAWGVAQANKECASCHAMSTHAPRTGSDEAPAILSPSKTDFNPRSLYGERRFCPAWGI